MKGLTQAVKPVSIPIKADLAGSVLSHLGIEITTKELGSQRSFSKVMNVLKKNASHWEAFFVSARCKKGRRFGQPFAFYRSVRTTSVTLNYSLLSFKPKQSHSISNRLKLFFERYLASTHLPSSSYSTRKKELD
ncbi:hypothetical protein R7Z42_23375, partial [Vibrio sp. 1863]